MSAIIDFQNIPDDGRLWIFAADRQLDDSQSRRLLNRIDVFLERWTAHRQDLVAARDLRYSMFLFIAVDERSAAASGCSIDALVREVKEIGSELGVDFTGHGLVHFLDKGQVNQVPRAEFARLACEGRVTPDTVVFDNTLTRAGDVRSGKWQVAARKSWHQDVFFRERSRV